MIFSNIVFSVEPLKLSTMNGNSDFLKKDDVQYRVVPVCRGSVKAINGLVDRNLSETISTAHHGAIKDARPFSRWQLKQLLQMAGKLPIEFDIYCRRGNGLFQTEEEFENAEGKLSIKVKKVKKNRGRIAANVPQLAFT